MSDSMVLAAQQWLNAQFGAVAGYIRCPTDGNTGTATVDSAIMGLQHLLGISPVVPSFGPTTWADLNAYGAVDGASATEMITLAQCALYCKGYDGDALSGNWSTRIIAAVNKLQEDIGYGSSSTTSTTSTLFPKLFRFVLDTDPAVLIAGGSPAIRAAQQWLNVEYITRENFFFASCGGVFDRNTQTNLVYGLQYELGISDAVANGSFGPTTQADLKTNTTAHVTVGSTDGTKHFVHIFKAALLFNGYTPQFDGTFTSTDSAVVLLFQLFEGFTAAEQTGAGDFGTWAELLISTGDPTRTGTAADMASTITTARAASLVASGYTTVGRYLTNQQVLGALDKDIKPGELDVIFGAGLRLFLIFEEGNYEMSWFTYEQGIADADRANTAALNYGIPGGAVIYFTVDVDAEQSDIDAVILPYFRGVQAGFADISSDYVAGCYGTRNVCTNVYNRGLASYSFVAGLSTGWSGNLGFPLSPNWAFNQIETLTVGSGAGAIEIDKDVESGRDRGISSVTEPPALNTTFLNWVDRLQGYAEQWIADGYSITDPSILVANYIRYPTYGGRNVISGLEWDVVAGAVDVNFNAYVDGTSLVRVNSFVDPSGLEPNMDPQHLAASMNSVMYQKLNADKTLNLGDGGGWAGDFFSILIAWMHLSPQPDAYSWALGQIGAPDANHGLYDIGDYLQDIDAMLIAVAWLANPSVAINIVIREYYGTDGGWTNRFESWLAQRFENSGTGVYDIAYNSFTEISDPGWQNFRAATLSINGFESLPPDTDLQAFATAFHDQFYNIWGSSPA
jgi:peptidoglycan hydrolase-like protein with peptidoglycan-binding domain